MKPATIPAFPVLISLISFVVVPMESTAQDEVDPYLSALQSENRRLREENFKLRQKMAREELEKRISKNTVTKTPAEPADEEIIADRGQEADRDANTLYREHFAASHGVDPVPEVDEKNNGKANWSGQLALGGNATGGNVDGYRLHTDARIMRKNNGHRATITANGDYAETEATTTARQFNANIENRQDISKKSFVKSNTGYLHNDLLGIEHQTLASIGAGYYFAKTETTEWSVDAGPAYIYEKRDRQKPRHRANARFGHEVKHSLTEDLRLFQSGEILTALNDIGEWRYNTEAGIETDLSDHMSIRFSGKNRFESDVAEDRQHNDFSVGASLVFKLD